MKPKVPTPQSQIPIAVMRTFLRVMAQLDKLQAVACGLSSDRIRIGGMVLKIERQPDRALNYSPAHVAKVAFALRMLGKGVVVVSKRKPLRLACKKCCAEFAPKVKAGKFPDNFWLCSNGCNARHASKPKQLRNH